MCLAAGAAGKRHFIRGINTAAHSALRVRSGTHALCAHRAPKLLSRFVCSSLWFGTKKKKEKPTCVFLLLVSGFLSSPCVSRAACILKAPHLMSPLTPDAARWASLLLFSAFFSFSKCHDSALSLPTLGRFLSAGKSARCATDRAPSHPPVLSIINDPFHSDHSYSLYGPREFTLMFTIKLFLSLHILAAAGISSPDRTQLRMLARSPWCWGQTDGKRTALHHTDTGFCTHTLNRHRNTWHATRRHQIECILNRKSRLGSHMAAAGDCPAAITVIWLTAVMRFSTGSK